MINRKIRIDKKHWAIIFMLISWQALAYRLTGVVMDEKKEPLPYATVYIDNTTNAVSTNIKGEFSFELENGTYNIVFYSFGFEKKIVSVVIEGSNKRLNITLNQATIDLNETVVSANKEDPAYAIIRNTIKNKDKYQKLAETYSYKAYIKSSLTKEFLKKGPVDSLSTEKPKEELTKEHMNFLESYSTVYHQDPNKIKEVKEAYNDLSEKREGVSFVFSINNDPDAPRGEGAVNVDLFKTKISEAIFNFYDNLIYVPTLSKPPIISPLHYATFLSYNFHFEQSFFEDGMWINKIAVIPKRTDASLFKGYIYIVDSLWCIKSVDFTVDPFTLNYFKSFRIIQNYDLIRIPGKCLLSQEEFFHDSKEEGKTKYGNTIIKYSDYKLNEVFKKNFFKNEISVTVDEAYERDSAYWSKIRPISLKTDEAAFVDRIDSIETYHKSAEYLKKQDSITNKIRIEEVFFGMYFQNSFKKQNFYIDGLVNNVFSTIIPLGNFRPALRGTYSKELKKGYIIKPSGTIKYGITNKDIRGDIGLSYTYLPKKFGKASVKYENDYGPINQYQAITSAALMSNYVNNIGYFFGHEIEIINGLFFNLNAELLEKRPLNLSYDSWLSKQYKTDEDKASLAKTQGPVFTPFNKFSLDLTLTYTPFQKYYSEPYKKIIVGSKYPSFALNYRKGIPNVLNSIANYDFIEFRGWDDIRFGSFGESRWKVYAGEFANSASLLFSESKFFRMSDRGFFSNPLRSFQLLDTNISTFNAYFEAHYMHNFEGKLLNKIPLIKKLHLTEAIGGGILYINDKNFQHAEIFGGIEKPFTLWKQRFKIGCYYVVSDSNYSKASGQVKFGISMYDAFTNTWVY